MRLSALSYILIVAFIISFISFYLLITTSLPDETRIESDLSQIQNSIASLEKENKELQYILDGLESGKLSPRSFNVLRAIRSGGRDVAIDSGIMEDVALGTKSVAHSDTKSSINSKESILKAPQNKEKDSSNPTPLLPAASIQSGKKAVDPPSILVVGGTDGSGTRRVVQVLTQLGVPMVSEDPQTYDIHADLVGGWPTIVTPVLEETHSLTYESDSLSPQLSTKTKARLQKLLNRAREDSSKRQSFTLAVGGLLKRPPGATASGIEFGFKAPVAFTLLPMWSAVAPRLKFLHVLRDGRDIAFSANQGPVAKFYSTMYGSDFPPKHPAVMSIRLWADWNTAVHDWAKKHTTQDQVRSVGKSQGSLSYMFIHTEDLVPESSSLEVRFNTMSRIADWVGSSLNAHDICCLALQKTKFMGSHDGSREGHDTLKGRYGKWKDQIRVNPALGEKLMAAGGHGLSVFGYEGSYTPEQSNAAKNFHCSEQEQCLADDEGQQQQQKQNKKLSPASVVVVVTEGAKCGTYPAVDYRGGGFDIAEEPGSSPTDCCRLCKESTRCKHFTFNQNIGVCFLKSGKGAIVTDETATDLISGDIMA